MEHIGRRRDRCQCTVKSLGILRSEPHRRATRHHNEIDHTLLERRVPKAQSECSPRASLLFQRYAGFAQKEQLFILDYEVEKPKIAPVNPDNHGGVSSEPIGQPRRMKLTALLKTRISGKFFVQLEDQHGTKIFSEPVVPNQLFERYLSIRSGSPLRVQIYRNGKLTKSSKMIVN